MTNPLDPESKSLNGLKDLIYGFSHYSLLKNVMNADSNSVLVTKVSNDKRQRNLTLLLAPKYSIQNEDGSCILVSVLWEFTVTGTLGWIKRIIISFYIHNNCFHRYRMKR